LNETQKIPWKRISVEAAAIVASILLAFVIDAWWTERQAREEERTILTILQAEFVRLGDQVHYSRRFYSEILASAQTLIEIGTGVRGEVDGEEVDQLFADTIWIGELYEWNSGDLDSIISSGDIALISNRELRQRVGRWPATLSKVRDHIRRDHDFFSNRFMPYLSANIHLPGIINLPFSVPGHREVAYAYGRDINVAKTTEHRELLSRPEFQNLLWERVGSINDILYSALGFEDESREPRADFLEDLKSAIELIEQELAE